MLTQDQRWLVILVCLPVMAIAEAISLVPDPSPCLVEIQNTQPGAPPGDKYCAPLHELGIMLLGGIRNSIKANHDVVTALATALIAVFTLTLWRATNKLWKAGEKQINAAQAANQLNRDNMVASRRAWLSIEDVKLKDPTRFTETGLVFGVDVTIKNLGQTPATSVWIECESYFAENNLEKFPDAEKRFKAKMRAHHVELGDLLFPGDTLTQGQIWEDGLEKIRHAIGTRPSGDRKVGFTMFIAVSYRIVGEDSAHITYHAHGMLNVPIGTVVPSGQLIDLPRQPFLAGEAD